MVSEATADDVASFAQQKLKLKHVRCDYKELLELTIIVFGRDVSRSMTLKRPGADHHARWMAKEINTLKLYLLRDQLIVLNSERDQILALCQFFLHIIIKAWFLCPLVTAAPTEDLRLLKDLYIILQINPPWNIIVNYWSYAYWGLLTVYQKR